MSELALTSEEAHNIAEMALELDGRRVFGCGMTAALQSGAEAARLLSWTLRGGLACATIMSWSSGGMLLGSCGRSRRPSFQTASATAHHSACGQDVNTSSARGP